MNLKSKILLSLFIGLIPFVNPTLSSYDRQYYVVEDIINDENVTNNQFVTFSSSDHSSQPLIDQQSRTIVSPVKTARAIPKIKTLQIFEIDGLKENKRVVLKIVRFVNIILSADIFSPPDICFPFNYFW